MTAGVTIVSNGIRLMIYSRNLETSITPRKAESRGI